jgi:hypothetical protein
LDWFLMSDAELWQRMLPLATGAAVSPLVLLGQLAQLSGASCRLVALRRSMGYLLGALAVVVIWTLAAGWIVELANRADGLWARVRWTPKGGSPRWAAPWRGWARTQGLPA